MSGVGKIHTPVMLHEVLSYLNVEPGGIYVDMTVGAGGHSRAILEKLDASGCLVGIDRDAEILAIARQHLAETGKKFSLHQTAFSQVGKILAELQLSPGSVAGFLFDLGVSSYQLDNGQRGFSFSKEGPLDMRMGEEIETTAEIILRRYPEPKLAQIFFEYGEEPKSRKIAAAIVQRRQHKPLKSTLDLAQLVAEVTGYQFGRTHPATRIFQALRIAVNAELDELPQGLATALSYLKPGGRIVVISFHSLEDRIVKQFFRQHKNTVEIITPKPHLPTRAEEYANPRSRSAKLRCSMRRMDTQV